MKTQLPLIIGGPTASGKSALALQLAEKFRGVIINADSMQVYADLPILTAQPSADDLKAFPHQLYGIFPGAEVCSAARWRELAIAEIEAAQQQGLRPIIVGGTGLYILRLMQGIAYIPDIEPEIRQATRDLYQQAGAQEFYRMTIELDPLVEGRLNPGDQQRLVRAHEVMRSTGRSIFQWQQDPLQSPGIQCEMMIVQRDRDELHQRAATRFDQMLEQGALDEVEAIMQQSYDPSLPVMRALGVSELAGYLSNEYTLTQARELAIIATRQYIKRQDTFFRNQFKQASLV